MDRPADLSRERRLRLSFYAESTRAASFSRTSDKEASASRVSGCAEPKTRRRRLTTSCKMLSASSRSSPALGSKTDRQRRTGVDAKRRLRAGAIVLEGNC